MLYIKKLKKNEKLKMEAVETLPNSDKIMMPHLFLGSYCIMPMARKMVTYQRPDIEQLTDVLKLWYRQTTSSYSEGIYSFARHGRTSKKGNQTFYSYLKQELDDLWMKTSIKNTYKGMAELALEMWLMGYEKYKDTFFWSYNYLHGDLHSGNIVSFCGLYRLIDWENLRSGPKELELSFYLCWDYFRWHNPQDSLNKMLAEIEVFKSKMLLRTDEIERILYCLIPMWMLLITIYLNNGNLLFEQERTAVCQELIPLYYRTIFKSGLESGKRNE